MRARIHTVEQVSGDSKGKTAKVNTNSITVQAKSGRTRKGEDIKWLEVKAKGFHSSGSGERGGTWKEYSDSLTLQVYPEELKEIVRMAIVNGLVDMPGYKYLVEARANLENAISEMRANKRGSTAKKK